MNNRIFNEYQKCVNRNNAKALKKALENPTLIHTRLFKSMIDTTGDIHSSSSYKKGGESFGGSTHLSMLHGNTDIPTVAFNSGGITNTAEVGLSTSKMVCSFQEFSGASSTKRDEIVLKNIESNYVAHLKFVDEVALGLRTELEGQYVYGIGNHPDVERMFNETGTAIEDMSADEVFAYFKTLIGEFKVNNSGTDYEGQITIIVDAKTYNKLIVSEVTWNNGVVPVTTAIESFGGEFGGVKIKKTNSLSKMKAINPDNEGKGFVIIGFFNKYFSSLRIPHAPSLFGDIGAQSHSNYNTHFESYFASKTLGIELNGVSETVKPIVVVEGC